MPKVFTRLLTFKVEGEIYDNETKPEEIIKNYSWHYRKPNGEDDIHIMMNHKDHRGRITSIEKLPNIQKYSKKPDSEYFII